MWNLIDSHDTARFLHLCNDNKKKQHLAAAFQLLLPGMPMTVSYTHIDVYKRQLYGCGKNNVSYQ